MVTTAIALFQDIWVPVYQGGNEYHLLQLVSFKLYLHCYGIVAKISWPHGIYPGSLLWQYVLSRPPNLRSLRFGLV